MKQHFTGKILFLGCGSVAQCTLPLLLKHLEIPKHQISIIDAVDNRVKISEILAQGVHYQLLKITPDNLASTLSSYVGAGDMIIDLACNIGTMDILRWCYEHDVMYINTSVELWDPYTNKDHPHPTSRTLYHRHMQLQEMIKKWQKQNSATAVLEHGANPGLISHFAKKGLCDLATDLLSHVPDYPYYKALEEALADENFPLLGYLTSTKVVHISERDTQIVHDPKKVNEFVNTWSIEGLHEEATAPAELGWGTHEKRLPPNAFSHTSGSCNQICLAKMGMHTKVRSWVPSGEIIGMVIRHGEAFTLSKFLTLEKEGTILYRPTVHYAYCPSDGTIASLYELGISHYVLQPQQRIFQDEIIAGGDELGALLLGNEIQGWWTGSVLDIHTARKHIPGQNATTLQVAAGILSAVIWMINHPKQGVNVPEQLPFKEILAIAKPYLGEILSVPTAWYPTIQAMDYFEDYKQREVVRDYQFERFAV